MRKGILVRHFLARLFDNDLLSPQTDAHQGASLGIAMLLSFTTFLSVFVGAKYVILPFPMPGLTAEGYVNDAFLFVSLSMILLALVAVVAWDGLALDLRDEAILGPLPIPRRTIVGAKLAAMAILAGSVLTAVNGPAAVVGPSAALAQLPAPVLSACQLFIAHLAATVGAGAFGFFGVLALREVARLLLGRLWPSFSTRLQAVLIVVLATTLLLVPGWMTRVAERLAPGAQADWRDLASPPMWFVGLHQTLSGDVIVDLKGRREPPRRLQEIDARGAARHRAARIGSAPFARRAIVALTGVVLTALAAFLWNARHPPARRRTPRRADRVPRWRLSRLAGATIARAPAIHAGFAFTLRTLARSTPHRAALAVALGFGLALSTIGYGNAYRAAVQGGPSLAVYVTQTILLGCLLSGCDQAMRLPAHLPASWSVQLAWPGDPRGYVSGVQRALLVGVVLPALLVAGVVQVDLLGVTRAATHFVVGLLLAGIVIEARLVASPALPFLTPYASGGRLKVAPIAFVGLVFVSGTLALIEKAAIEGGVGSTLVLLGLLAAVWATLARWRHTPPRGDELDAFQASLDEATQLRL
jgi:hypothetical protein